MMRDSLTQQNQFSSFRIELLLFAPQHLSSQRHRRTYLPMGTKRKLHEAYIHYHPNTTHTTHITQNTPNAPPNNAQIQYHTPMPYLVTHEITAIDLKNQPNYKKTLTKSNITYQSHHTQHPNILDTPTHNSNENLKHPIHPTNTRPHHTPKTPIKQSNTTHNHKTTAHHKPANNAKENNKRYKS